MKYKELFLKEYMPNSAEMNNHIENALEVLQHNMPCNCVDINDFTFKHLDGGIVAYHKDTIIYEIWW